MISLRLLAILITVLGACSSTEDRERTLDSPTDKIMLSLTVR